MSYVRGLNVCFVFFLKKIKKGNFGSPCRQRGSEFRLITSNTTSLNTRW